MTPSTRLETHWRAYKRRHLVGDDVTVASHRQAFYGGAQAAKTTLLDEIADLPDGAREREVGAIEAELACFQQSLEGKP